MPTLICHLTRQNSARRLFPSPRSSFSSAKPPPQAAEQEDEAAAGRPRQAELEGNASREPRAAGHDVPPTRPPPRPALRPHPSRGGGRGQPPAGKTLRPPIGCAPPSAVRGWLRRLPLAARGRRRRAAAGRRSLVTGAQHGRSGGAQGTCGLVALAPAGDG